jgi:hypothetical protein
MLNARWAGGRDYRNGRVDASTEAARYPHPRLAVACLKVLPRGRGQLDVYSITSPARPRSVRGEGEAECLRGPWIAPSAHRSQLASVGITSARLLNHLVGANEKRSRNRQAKRHRDFQIDQQLVLGLKIDRQVPWLRTSYNADDVASHVPHNIGGG